MSSFLLNLPRISSLSQLAPVIPSPLVMKSHVITPNPTLASRLPTSTTTTTIQLYD